MAEWFNHTKAKDHWRDNAGIVEEWDIYKAVALNQK